MSLAGQISDTVNALAASRDARRQALGHIRSDTVRHLGEARDAHRRMAELQQQQLTEAVRSTKVATAMLLGAADEQIDEYRKARLQNAERLGRELADGARALRTDTRKWRSTLFAMRSRHSAEALRERRRGRAALHKEVQAQLAQNLAFLSALAKDRQEASAIWLGRAVVSPLPDAGKEPAAKPAATVKAERAMGEPTPGAVSKPQPLMAEPQPKTEARPAAEPSVTRAPAAKPQEAAAPETKVSAGRDTKAGEAKGPDPKTADRSEHGKPA